MMTEDEAKTKWCPFARVPFAAVDSGKVPIGAPVSNRTADGTATTTHTCFGSACMAFRWGRAVYPKRVSCDDRRAMTEPSRPSEIPPSWTFEPYLDEGDDNHSARWVEPQEEANKRHEGYCGLAGKP